ncbi:hypothetical protein POM88_016009 [Heracleum sosnowskyi]|uniref:Uncharacterized protein n=1 Tax=Heracleum sosnowskyi TaxID=360622 RepID=A0AAD8ILR5_9APIA|nr:hypothetical protein POM88_016009 [Heracleum sosnowskyi]
MFREIPKSVGYLQNLEVLVIQRQLFDMNLFSIPDSISCLSSLQHLNLSGNHFLTLTSSLGHLTNLESLTLTECKELSEIQELPPKLSDLYASFCISIKTLDVSEFKQLRFLYLSYCSSLVKVAGLEKLESIRRIDMSGCENLLINFEESLFQGFTAIRERIDIYLPVRYIPCWFWYQLDSRFCSRLVLKMTRNLSKRCLGIILWFNVGDTSTTEDLAHFSEFGASISVINPLTSRKWFCTFPTHRQIQQIKDMPLRKNVSEETLVDEMAQLSSIGSHDIRNIGLHTSPSSCLHEASGLRPAPCSV